MVELSQILQNNGFSEERFLEDLEETLKNPHSRNLIWAILCQTGVFHGGHNKGEYLHFLNGKRDVGIFILQLMDLLEKDYFSIMRADARKRMMEAEKEEENEDEEPMAPDIFEG